MNFMGTTPAGRPATEEFEGDWRMVSCIMDGKPLDQSLMKWVKRVTKGNVSTVYAGPQTMMRVEFTSDSSQSPMTIDYVHTAGAAKGKAQSGIYEWDGEVLRICVSAPGAPRPTTFEYQPGGSLTEWKRP